MSWVGSPGTSITSASLPCSRLPATTARPGNSVSAQVAALSASIGFSPVLHHELEFGRVHTMGIDAGVRAEPDPHATIDGLGESLTGRARAAPWRPGPAGAAASPGPLLH